MIICQLCLDFGLIFHCSLLWSFTAHFSLLTLYHDNLVLGWSSCHWQIIMNLLSTFFGLGYPLVDSPKRDVKVVEGFLLMLLLPGYQFPLLRIGGLLTTRSERQRPSRRWRPYGSSCPKGGLFGPRNGHLNFPGKESFGTSIREGSLHVESYVVGMGLQPSILVVGMGLDS